MLKYRRQVSQEKGSIVSELKLHVDGNDITFSCLMTGIDDKQLLEQLEAAAVDRFTSAFRGFRRRFTDCSDSTWKPHTDSGVTSLSNSNKVTVEGVAVATALTIVISFRRKNAPEMSRIAQELARLVFIHLSHSVENALRPKSA